MAALDEIFRRSIVALWTIYLLAGAVVVVVLAVVIRSLVRTYREYRDKRLVTCPETGRDAAVDIDALHAAVTSLFGPPDLRIANCSNWPERRHCDLECVRQIDLSPLGCPVHELLASWYAGKDCVLCGRSFRKFRGPDRRALLSPQGNLVECETIRPENILDVLSTHKPVCDSCKATRRVWMPRADIDEQQVQHR